MQDYKQIQLRQDAAADWTAADPVLAPGEFGVEMDSSPKRLKIGDGSTPWSALPYFGGSGGSVDSVDGQTGDVDLTSNYEPKRQNNLTATTDPTVNDDSAAGYEVLSRWVNTTGNGEFWICLDATNGAAVWQQATLTLDELGSAALADTGDFAAASHAHPLSDLMQSGATDGQIPTWDNTAGEWVPDDPSGGGSGPSYDTATVALGGDFSANVYAKCVRIGDQVTVTVFEEDRGESVKPTHSLDAAPLSASGDIPALYRPAAGGDVPRNTYHVSGGSGASLESIHVLATGALGLNYADFSGNAALRNSASSLPSITYLVDLI